MSLGFLACKSPDDELPAGYRNIEVPAARLASPAARQHGRELFLAHCALCHGRRADGHGTRREGFGKPPADFSDPAWRKRTSPRRAYHAIREGVPSSAMPSWRALDDRDIWDLVAYVLSVSSEGP